ncbi:MAG: MarR family transcriptional regulator [Phycisphaeraceae bacterium]
MSSARSTSSFSEPPIDDPSQRRLPPLLRRAWYSLNQAFRRRIAPLGITPDQFTVLRWLHEYDGKPLTQRKLADLMSSDPNTVTSVLNRMEAAGHIERKQHQSDRRAKLVKLRPLGREVYEASRKIAVDLQHQVLQAIPAEDREAFFAQLERVADACNAATIAPPTT